MTKSSSKYLAQFNAKKSKPTNQIKENEIEAHTYFYFSFQKISTVLLSQN